MTSKWERFFFRTILSVYCFSNFSSYAYPIFAQQNYANPREFTGRIVCANCHLAQKPVSLGLPQAVRPGSIFEVSVGIPHSNSLKQILSIGNKKGPLNLGAILIVPKGFALAPKNSIGESLKNRVGRLNFLPYRQSLSNALVVGPIPGENSQEIVFPIIAPENSNSLKNTFFAGGNRGRGQVYPNGEKRNNNLYTSQFPGIVSQIQISKKGAKKILINSVNNNRVSPETIFLPSGVEIIVSEGQKVSIGQSLTTNPNLGGFGQSEKNLVIMPDFNLRGLILFLVFAISAQVFLVLKKKQFEKVQKKELLG